MKVWITKYALTDGIICTEGKDMFGGIWVKDESICLGRNHFFERTEYSMTKQSAIQKAEEMRQKEIASLKKQIEKLEEMRFE